MQTNALTKIDGREVQGAVDGSAADETPLNKQRFSHPLVHAFPSMNSLARGALNFFAGL
jgi:hypothetical protein